MLQKRKEQGSQQEVEVAETQEVEKSISYPLPPHLLSCLSFFPKNL